MELTDLVHRVENAVLARTVEIAVNRELVHPIEAKEMDECLRDLLWIKSHRLGWPDFNSSSTGQDLSWSPGAKMHWKEAFSECLHESSRDHVRTELLKARLLVAEIAIMNRGLELGTAPLGASERSELMAATTKITEIGSKKLG